MNAFERDALTNDLHKCSRCGRQAFYSIENRGRTVVCGSEFTGEHAFTATDQTVVRWAGPRREGEVFPGDHLEEKKPKKRPGPTRREQLYDTFVTTSLFLAERLGLDPEEIISCTSLMQQRCGKRLNMKLSEVLELNMETAKAFEANHDGSKPPP